MRQGDDRDCQGVARLCKLHRDSHLDLAHGDPARNGPGMHAGPGEFGQLEHLRGVKGGVESLQQGHEEAHLEKLAL